MRARRFEDQASGLAQQDHSPPLHEEPNIKQKGDPTILPFVVIELLIRCNFLYNQRKNLHVFNFFEETKDGDSAGNCDSLH